MNATTVSTRYTFEDKCTFKGRFSAYNRTRIRAALRALDDQITLLGEPIPTDYAHTTTVWLIRTTPCTLDQVKATNTILNVDICGNSPGHLVKKIGLVTNILRRFIQPD